MPPDGLVVGSRGVVAEEVVVDASHDLGARVEGDGEEGLDLVRLGHVVVVHEHEVLGVGVREGGRQVPSGARAAALLLPDLPALGLGKHHQRRFVAVTPTSTSPSPSEPVTGKSR